MVEVVRAAATYITDVPQDGAESCEQVFSADRLSAAHSVIERNQR
jgi:hypothetical protein